jgi:sterol desaturase/sphingolipid hydroxylase (fatty acid hydroxylase superfamily)
MLSIVVVYVGLAALGPLLSLAARVRPAREGTPALFTRARAADWLYWIVTPLFSGFLSRTLVIAVGAIVAWSLGGAVTNDVELFAFFAARSVLGAIPAWAQLVVCLTLVDLLSYWSHRLRHHPLFFPLHAVHHSAEELDWLAAARMHPLDEIVDNVAISVPVLLLGPEPWVFLVLGPITLLYTLFSHAAVDLPLGPLRLVVVSPAFHRLHHAADVPGVNYAGMLSLWDRLFGTFRDPESNADAAARTPLRFGLGEQHLAPTLHDHLVAPVRRFFTGA